MTVDKCRLEIGNRMINGHRFDDVEDWINGLPFPEDTISALWLYALSYVPPARQRRQALEHLVAVSG